MRFSRFVLVVLACVLAGSLAGCGGGGGGGSTYDSSLLNGSYVLWAMGATDGMPDFGSAGWGPVTLDGMGALGGTVTVNEGGTVSTGVAVMGTYTVAGDRQTTFSLGGMDGYAGWTNAAGSLSLGGTITPGADPTLAGFVKLGSGYGDASLSGDYFLGIFYVGGGTAQSYWGSATFDGVGGGSMTLAYNSEGSITAPYGVNATYNVAGDGQTTLTIGASNMLGGAVLAGGDVLVLAADSQSMAPPFLMVCVRKTTGASAATFSGSYQLIGLERDGGGGFVALTGSILSDGMGSLTASLTRDTDGTITTPGPEVASYTAGADGSLTVNPMGDPLEGGFSAGGSYAVFAGPTDAMTNPGFYFLMRR